MPAVTFTVVRTGGGWAVRSAGETIAFADASSACAEATRLAMAAGGEAEAIDDSDGAGRILWRADPALAVPHPVWGEGQHTDDAGGRDRPDHLAGQNPKSAEIPTANDLGRLRAVPPAGHAPPAAPGGPGGAPATDPAPIGNRR